MIEKKYKYITIKQGGPDKAGKPVYQIVTNKSGSDLGMIYWFASWKLWEFSPAIGAVFDSSCLRDIVDFLENHAGKEA